MLSFRLASSLIVSLAGKNRYRTIRETSSAKLFMTSKSAESVDAFLGKVQIPVHKAIQYHDQLVFLDGSWWLGQRETTSRQDFEAGPRIAGARFFDIDDVCTPSGPENPNNLPHMMPSAVTFAATMDAMDIRNENHLVVYGQEGCPFLHRTWFQLVCMGHDYRKVHLLEGSLQSWIEAKGPIETAPTVSFRVKDLDDTDKESSYTATPARNVVDVRDMRNLISNGLKESTTTVVDVRSADRFYGRVEEPRAGLIRGHMPGALNLFFLDLLDKDDVTKLKDKKDLEAILRERLGEYILDDNRRIVATCGSGATACTLAVALIAAGKDPRNVSIYDGSWCEWGADKSNPIVTD